MRLEWDWYPIGKRLEYNKIVCVAKSNIRKTLDCQAILHDVN